VTTRLVPLAFFVVFAVLAMATWWLLGAPGHADKLRVHNISVDTG